MVLSLGAQPLDIPCFVKFLLKFEALFADILYWPDFCFW
jgi:hypothetical protein